MEELLHQQNGPDRGKFPADLRADSAAAPRAAGGVANSDRRRAEVQPRRISRDHRSRRTPGDVF